mmetsp:Transcript_118629/g.332201  ORF Transcript_118629/g.332201 Transcript_118629/m.332201 type:complete len:329 (-) Transcript_118629:69-1055(-)
MKVHTAFLAAFAAGFAASGTAEARRMSAESAAALPPSSLVSAFCAVGGFDYLIRANNFEALRDLALWCPGGHATAAHALAESGGLADEEWTVREKTIDALGAQVLALMEQEPEASDLVVDVIERLVRTLDEDKNTVIRLDAARALTDLLLASLSTSDGTADHCLDALTRSVSKDRVGILRAGVVDLLGKLAVDSLKAGHRDFIEDLQATFRDVMSKDSEMSVRLKGVTALRRLASAALHRHEDIAEECIAVFATVGLKDREMEVRMEVVNAISDIALSARRQHLAVEEQAVEALELAMKDKASHVSHNAYTTLVGLGLRDSSHEGPAL